MSSTKILVACHKKCEAHSNDVYMPIHVGKALSNCNLEFQGDDTGDNISIKNPYYCELTAQYWGWKNLDCDYIGLCHYRRYFKTQFTEDKVRDVLSVYDIILPKPTYHSFSMCAKMEKSLTLEDEAIFFKILQKFAPDYEKKAISYLKGNMDISYNMFLCRKVLFNQFCEWQFKILSECEKYIKLSEYSRLKRIFGYFAEYLLPIYSLSHNYKIKYDEVVDYNGKSLQPSIQIKKLLYPLTQIKLPASLDSLISDAVKVGLQNDNIVI